MRYSLDTNTCSRYINGRAPELRERISTIPAPDIVVCSIVRAELFFGAAKSQTPEASLIKQLRFLRPYGNVDFDIRAAEIFGPLRASLETKGVPIGAYDLLIAAIALANNLTLVTHNTEHFSRVEGLQIEDWEL